jgi:hypothetical protein
MTENAVYGQTLISAVQIKLIFIEKGLFSWYFRQVLKFLKVRLVFFAFVIPAEAGIQGYRFLGSGFPFSRE